MINYISSWAGQVITCVIVAIILEMIIPKGNSKKYIKTIIGVYILYTMISPVIKFVSGGDLKIDYSDYEKYFGSINNTSEINVASVEDTYNAELEKKIQLDIESLGYTANKIKIKFNIEKGIIEKLSMNVKINNNTKSEENSIKIDKIEIGETKEKNTLSEDEIQKIKQKINEDYGVNYENIIINSMENGG